MRKFVSPRTGPVAKPSLRRTSSFGNWLEGLEQRRMLAATPFRLDEVGSRFSPRLQAAIEMGGPFATSPATPTTALTTSTTASAEAATALAESQTYSGALNGKIVYTSGGHGWQWNTTLNRYATDRGDNNEIVEDFGNQEQMSFYADYALRAGATVVPMRPVGYQPNEVVLDNDSPGVTFGAGWTNSASPVHYDEDYGLAGGGNADAVGYRFRAANATESAVATYQPTIPQAGFYPVYTWVLSSTNRVDQLYRVNHTGGATELRVDHRKVGRGWVYLGTYHFDAGSNVNGNVQISNQSPVAGQVIADAIRFGNGMGDHIDSPAPTVSGYTREDENSLAWITRSIGVGTSLSAAIGSGASNVSAPSEFAEWMNSDTNPFGTSVYIGFHSNAGGGRGAVGLIDSDQGTRNQSALALFTGRQINQDMQALNGQFEHNWSTRTTHTYTAGFGEIDLGAGSEMDATIIETAFHDSAEDAALMRDPRVRMQLAKSTLDATLEYFDHVDTTTVQVSAPAAPVSPRATVSAGGNVTLNWASGPTGVRGGTANGYRVYVSRDGKGFGRLADVAITSFTIPAADLDGGAYYFRVAALNAGGESPMSYAVGARKNGTGGGGGTNRILVVNGFDRFDRGGNVRGAYAFTPDRLIDRVRPLLNNSFNYVVAAGEAIEAYTAGGVALGFDSVQNEHVTAGLLSQYRTVVWLAGEESTDDESFSAIEQSAVSSFVGSGGTLFVSGSEIGWDLDRPTGPTAADRSFYNNTLKADYVSDDAGTYNATAPAGSIFAGLPSLSFDTGSTVYDADFPDVLATSGGSTAALNYSGGTGGIAATQWATAASASGARVVNMAFPFETISADARRNDVMSRVLSFFQTAVSETPGIPDLVATSDSGQNNGDNITNRDNSSGAKALQFLVGGTVAGSTVTIYADGVAIGSATGTAGTTTVTTNGTRDLADGSHSITARQQETGKSVSNSSASLGVMIETTPPVVTGVFVNGRGGWTTTFRDYLASSGEGDAQFGYRLDAADHADELPWVNMNQVSVRFSENVNVTVDDMVIRGVNVAEYQNLEFAYDASTFTATWTLPLNGSFGPDKLLLDLNGAGVIDMNGNLLDGEWTNPTPGVAGGGDTFPSGDGVAGGDFHFRLNVLPGDVNRSGGSVLGSDVTLTRNAQNSTPGAPNSLYTIFKDVNGSRSILGSDVTLVRNRQGFRLPTAEPIAPPDSAADEDHDEEPLLP